MVNLNKEGLSLSLFPYGKTQNVEVRIGRKLYMLDVDRNALYTDIDFYRKVSADREKYSKYDPEAELVSVVQVRSDSVLNKDFFEKIREISKAQDLCKKYGRLLAM